MEDVAIRNLIAESIKPLRIMIEALSVELELVVKKVLELEARLDNLDRN